MTNVTLNVTLKEKSDLTENESFVYNLIKNNNKISRDSLASQLNLSTRSIQRITNSLSRKGYIIRVGNNRFGYWEIIK